MSGAACERLPELGVSHRRTTVSTVGWIPGIEALAEQPLPLRLAVSIHAADEALRSQWGERPPEKFIKHASP